MDIIEGSGLHYHLLGGRFGLRPIINKVYSDLETANKAMIAMANTVCQTCHPGPHGVIFDVSHPIDYLEVRGCRQDHIMGIE